MSNEAAIVAGFIGGVLLTVIGTVLAIRLQKNRLRLAYSVLRAHPLIPFATQEGDLLRVMVRSDATESTSSEPMSEREIEYVDAGRVYGFDVIIVNTGTSKICGDEGSPGVDVLCELDEDATILSIAVESPALRPSDLVTEKHYLSRVNLGRCWFKYLNIGEMAKLSIQSIGNAGNTIKVSARSPGLEPLYDGEARFFARVYLFVSSIGFIAAVTAITAIGWGIHLYGLMSSPHEVFDDGIRGQVIASLSILGAWMATLSFLTIASSVRVRSRIREFTHEA